MKLLIKGGRIVGLVSDARKSSVPAKKQEKPAAPDTSKKLDESK